MKLTLRNQHEKFSLTVVINFFIIDSSIVS